MKKKQAIRTEAAMKRGIIFIAAVVLLICMPGKGSALTPEMESGVNYLASTQDAGGFWNSASSSTDQLTATAEVIGALQLVNATSADLTGAVTWLSTQELDTTAQLSQRILALSSPGTDLDMLLSYADSLYSAWGGYEGYDINVLHTALALRALRTLDYTDTNTINSALGYLVAAQNADGGWGFRKDGPSNTYVTALVLKAMLQFRNIYNLEAIINSSVNYLLLKQNSDGGFGSSPSTVYETALALDAIVASDANKQSELNLGINYLVTAQNANGSWGDDPYSTALALKALSFVKPDLSIGTVVVFQSPAVPTTGDSIRLSANAANDGLAIANTVTVRFFDGDPEAEGVLINDSTINSISQGGTESVSIDWTVPDGGVHNIFAIIDPEDTIAEVDETDNFSIGQIRTYEKIDFTVESITFVPDLPSPGQEVDVQVEVTNMGGLAGKNITVRLEVDGGTMDEAMIQSLESLQSEVIIFTLSNLSYGIHEIRVMVDPGNTIKEGNEANNTLMEKVEVKDRIDLVASGEGLYMSDGAPKDGDVIYLAASVYNARESTAGNVLVRFYEGVPDSGGIQIGDDQVIASIPGGSSRQTEWVEFDTFGKAGRNTLYILIDPLDTVEETNEYNNHFRSSLEVSGRQDLIVQGMQFSPSSPEEGDMVTVKAVVKNIGSTQSNNTKLKIYDGNPSTGGEQIAADLAVSYINPGSTRTLSISYNTAGKLGDNTIYAVVDPYGDNDEINKTNNSKSEVLTVNASTRPDFTVSASDISFTPEIPAMGDVITLSAQVRNIRNTPASGVEVSFYNGDPSSGGDLLGSVEVPEIQGMGTGSASITWDLTNLYGNHTVYAMVDPDNAIVEANEANNSASSSIQVRLPREAAPLNLRATAVNNTDVQLQWEPPIGAEAYGIVGYSVYRNDRRINGPRDVAGQGAASASSAAHSYYAAQKAVDGNINSYWRTSYRAPLPQWWQAEFNTPKEIASLAIYWYSGYYSAKDYEIQTWDGAQWITRESVTGNNRAVTVHRFLEPVSAEKVRIYVTASNNPYYPAYIREVNIYESQLAKDVLYEDKNLGPGEYEYFVTAVSTDQVESLSSNTAVAVLGDVTPPATPTGLNAVVNGFDVNLSWNSNSEPDLAGYRVYRDGLNVALKSRGTTIVGSNGENHYSVMDGSVSSGGYTQWDTSPPGTMTVILPRTYNINKLKLFLYENEDWSCRYKIESSVDGQNWQTVVDKTSGAWKGVQEDEFAHPVEAMYFRITGTFCSYDKYFRVLEFEAYTPEMSPGTNEGVGSLDINVNNYPNFHEYAYNWNTSSRKPRSFAFSRFNTGKNDVLYIYDRDTGLLLASYSGDVGPFVTVPLTARNYRFQFIADHEKAGAGFHVTEYIVKGSQTATTHTDSVYTKGEYKYAVSAIDTSGNESGLSDIRTAVISDTTPPAAPDSLAAEAGNKVVDLSWTKNTEPDLAGYNLYRDDETIPVNGDKLISVNSYKDLGVVNLTEYMYRITAVDINGNESAKTSRVSAMPTGIELAISASDISFRPRFPSVFDNIEIFATVHNLGTDKLELPTSVKFYAGDPSSEGVEIGSATIQSLLPEQTTLVTFVWNPAGHVGTNTIFIAIENNKSAPDLNENNNMASFEITVNPEPKLMVNVTSIDSTNFPEVTASVRVGSWSGEGIFDLAEKDFMVSENNIDEKPVTVELLNSPGHKPIVDIVVVFDDTGSMGGRINGLKQKVNDFLSSLIESNLDYFLGVVTFKDNYKIYNQGYLTGNDATFTSWVNGLYASGGGDAPEDSLDALEAATTMNFRPGSQKVFILITDQAPHVAGDGTPYSTNTIESIKQKLLDAGAVTFVVGPELEGEYYGEGSISQATNGKFYNISSDFSSIIDDLSGEIASLLGDYRITYTTHNPARDGTLRDIAIEAMYRYVSGTGTGQYTAPFDGNPDATVKSMTLSNDYPLGGEEVSVTAEILNLGGVVARDVIVRFFEGDPSYGIRLGDDQGISVLSPSGMASVSVPWKATFGTHEIHVVIDPENSLAESDESNNTDYKVAEVPGWELPELGVTSYDISFSDNAPAKGESIIVTAIIHNTGAVARDVLVMTYLGDPANDGVLIGSTTINEFASDNFVEMQTPWVVDRPAGSCDIYFWVDPYDNIREGDESDNKAFNALAVTGTVASVSVSTDKPEYPADTDVGITVSVRNDGLDLWSGAGEVYIEDSSGKLVDHIGKFTVDDLKPSGLSGWTYRMPANVTADSERKNTLAETVIDFSAVLEELGLAGHAVDGNSVRVLESYDEGTRMEEKQAQAEFITGTSARVVWLVDGLTTAGETRHFYVYFDIVGNGTKGTSDHAYLSDKGKLIAYADDNGRFYIAQNNGDGTFGSPVYMGDVGDYTRGVVLDDFNNDGYADIIVGRGYYTAYLYYFQNKGDGSNGFLPAVNIATIYYNYWVMDMAAADFNNDGNKDFVVSKNDARLYLFLGSGDGMFTISSITSPAGATHLRGKDVADVNGDGFVDLVVGANPGMVFVYQGNGDGTFDDAELIAEAGVAPYGVVAGDFDGDGYVDIISNQGSEGDSYLMRGNGDGTFGDPEYIASLDTNNHAAFESGDFNNDGNLDIIAATYSNKTIEYYPGNGNGTFGEKTKIASTSYNTLAITAAPALPGLHPQYGASEAVPAVEYTFVWNTGTAYAGEYDVRAVVTSTVGDSAEGTSAFEILPDINVASKVSTDKVSYSANEDVAISSSVSSLSRNHILEDLDAKITVRNSSGVELFAETKDIDTMVPGQLVELKTYWETAQNAAGMYTVALDVLDGGSVLSTSSTSFEILGSMRTGEGLLGGITVEPGLVKKGRDETLLYTVTNEGNEDLDGLAVEVLVVNPETLAVEQTFETTVDLVRGATATGSFTASTSGLVPQVYLAVLRASTPEMSEPRALASDTFEVEAPTVEVTKSFADVKNVLVWLNYNWQSGRDCPDVSLIENALVAAGANYHIVYGRKDFQSELRNPFYTDYVILGEHHPLEDHYAASLREKVFSGRGLVSAMFNRHDLDESVFGMKFTGHLTHGDYPVEFAESDISPEDGFQSQGRVLRVEAADPAGTRGWIVGTSRKGAERHPALIQRTYGLGNVLFYAFDLGLSTGDYARFESLMVNSLDYVHNAGDLEGVFHSYQLVPVEVRLKSLGDALDIRLEETYPCAFGLLDPGTGQWAAENPWVTDVHIGAEETESIYFYTLTPDATGTYTFTSTVGNLEDGEYNHILDSGLKLSVRSIHDMTLEVLEALQSLPVSAEEQALVLDAMMYVQSTQGRVILTGDDVKGNIGDMLRAIHSLLPVASADTTDVMLMLDRLLAAWEGRWYFGY